MSGGRTVEGVTPQGHRASVYAARHMDWATLLAAAGLSGVVSWLTARHVAVRQRRAGDHEDARAELRELLTPTRRLVAQYRADVREGRDATKGRTEDAALAGKVLALADRLPWWRRVLVRRRLRRLVGPVWFDLAELHGVEDDTTAFNAWFVSQVAATRAERRGEHVERSSDLGTLHRALSGERDAPVVAEVERDLRRLASGW